MKIAFLSLAAAIILAETAYAGEKEEVDSAFNNWRNALASRDAEQIVELYDKDAILLATLSAKPILDQEGRKEYFSKLVVRKNLNAVVDEKHIKLLDDSNAVISGLYTFKFEDEGKEIAIPARYSFVYEKENGKWMIVEHHSSKVPQ